VVTWAQVAPALHPPGSTALPPRVLLRTYREHPGDRWDPGLAGIAPEVIEQLADRGVKLIGIDTASIDPADSKTLAAHQAIRQRGLRVLENLVLQDVPEGDYELIALPLKLITADASPVRAVLRSLP
jgi:arylformamidase